MKLDFNEDDYVVFNSERTLGQNQYASRFVEGTHGEPNLGEGLRWFYKDVADYHQIKIHKDDLQEFHNRVIEHKKNTSMGKLFNR